MAKNENLIEIIDLIHKSAHEGAFDNLDPNVIESLTDFFTIFLDIRVTTEQAVKITGKSAHVIRSTVNKEMKKSDGYKTLWTIKLKPLLKALGIS